MKHQPHSGSHAASRCDVAHETQGFHAALAGVRLPDGSFKTRLSACYPASPLGPCPNAPFCGQRMLQLLRLFLWPPTPNAKVSCRCGAVKAKSSARETRQGRAEKLSAGRRLLAASLRVFGATGEAGLGALFRVEVQHDRPSSTPGHARRCVTRCVRHLPRTCQHNSPAVQHPIAKWHQQSLRASGTPSRMRSSVMKAIGSIRVRPKGMALRKARAPKPASE